MKKYFITGIGTGIGKTMVSAIITEKLQADYWKPIQSGDLHQSDSITVSKLISNSKTKIYAESYRLTQPLSPHLSAKLDGIEIDFANISLPNTQNTLVIEGAGGLMVPLNNQQLILDLIVHLQTPVILVSQHYLGSINHTLLTIQTLKEKKIPIKGIIFNGDENIESESYILNYTGIDKLGYIPTLKTIDKNAIFEAGKHLQITSL